MSWKLGDGECMKGFECKRIGLGRSVELTVLTTPVDSTYISTCYKMYRSPLVIGGQCRDSFPEYAGGKLAGRESFNSKEMGSAVENLSRRKSVRVKLKNWGLKPLSRPWAGSEHCDKWRVQ